MIVLYINSMDIYLQTNPKEISGKYNNLDKEERPLTKLKDDQKKTNKLPFSKDDTTTASGTYLLYSLNSQSY